MGLPKFERRNVRKAALTVAKTGNGLDEQLGFEPIALNVGDEIYLVVKARIFDIHHQAENRKNPDQDDLIRVHASDAIEVAMISEADAEPLLKAADARLAEHRVAASLAEEEAQGIQRLPIAEGDD